MKGSIEKQVTATYVGGPTVIIEINNFRIITDPTLDPEGATFQINGEFAEKKLIGPAITNVGKIDLVLLSHDQHPDNLDKAGRELLKSVTTTITTKSGAVRLQNGTIGLAPWESTLIQTSAGDEIVITATPARHGPSGIEKITGDVNGFLIQVNGDDGFEIYLTGDTVFYEGIKEVSNIYKPRYVFIYAGAARPRGPFNITMGSNDAIDTAFAFPESIIIPLHFEGWSHYTENGEVLTEAFSKLGIVNRLKILKAGEVTELSFTTD